MAAISKYRGKWKCQVRKHGFPPRTKTFETRADAAAWGRMIESEIERGVFVNRDEAERTTVADLLARYLRDVSPTKRSGKSDKGRVKTLTKRIGAYKLSVLVSPHLVAYRDARLRVVSAQTVIHELNLLNRVLTLATREWGIVLPGGVPKVIKPRAPHALFLRRLFDDLVDEVVADLNVNDLVCPVVVVDKLHEIIVDFRAELADACEKLQRAAFNLNVHHRQRDGGIRRDRSAHGAPLRILC